MLTLLKPLEGVSQAKKRADADMYQAVKVQELITKKYSDLEKAELDFREVLNRQRIQWDKEEKEAQGKVVSLRTEVATLEERRREALVPLKTIQEALDNRVRAVSEREEKVSVCEQSNEDTKTLLQRRLDEVSDREMALDTLSKTLDTRQKGIDMQKEEIQRSSSSISAALDKSQAALREKERELVLREAAIQTKENRVLERERIVEEKEKGFVAREKQITDRYETMLSTEKEFNKKHGKINRTTV